MARLFYPVLWSVTAWLALAPWTRVEGPGPILESIGPRKAAAQEVANDRPGGVDSRERYPLPGRNLEEGFIPGAAEDPLAKEPDARELPSTKILGQVGNEVVLLADLRGYLNELSAILAGKLKPEESIIGDVETFYETRLKRRLAGATVPEEQIVALMPQLAAARVRELLDVKTALLEARLKLKEEEAFDKFIERASAVFDKEEGPRRMKRAKITTTAAFDAALKERGSSIAQERRAFAESVLQREFLRQKIKVSEEITHDEMLEYYREHQESFAIHASARWEQLMVRYASFDSRAQARRAMGAMGNEILDGRAFAEVAREGSEGPTADKGGIRDKTTPGSLSSEILDQAVFSLPVGELSEIIADDVGYHIIRVIERTEEGVRPFEEVQETIQDRIRDERFTARVEDYALKARAKWPSVSIYDPSPEDAARLKEAEERYEGRFSKKPSERR